MNNFSHLHLHTEYSILDGMAKIPKLIAKAYEDGQRAIAITDHGNMYGVFEFMNEISKFNKKLKPEEKPIKGIIGSEVYVARNGRTNRTKREDRSGWHLVLLAKNMTGYRNLSKLSSISYEDENSYYTARIDKDLLRTYSEGLIACSACLGGELAKAITLYNSVQEFQNNAPLNLEEAEKVALEYRDIFGEDYYMEMQIHGHPEQEMVNAAIKQLSEKLNIPYIATNDVHFINRYDFEAHRVLLALNTGKSYVDLSSTVQDSESDPGLFYTGNEYLKSYTEMIELFKEYPEAVTNTQLIVDKVEFLSLEKEVELPHFPIPERFENESEYLEYLVYEGAKKRWPDGITPDIEERIQFELSTVNRMQYPGYFLIVWDFIKEGRKRNIRFGPGRGSAAGSILAYCLEITNVDPIKYQLLFERFLNPDRVSLPDMDIDIDDEGRDEVIKYVIEKYGADKVAQIITFNTMATRSSIRDCLRVLDVPYDKADKIAKLIPDGAKNFKDAYEKSPELKEELEKGEPLIQKGLKLAELLEGTIKSYGVHPCGVIISKDPLMEQIPLATSKNSTTPITQYEGTYVESAGLLKMDFLGLKTLSIINEALKNIKKSKGIDLNIDDIPLDDKLTYQLLSAGNSIGVFQLESPGMRKYLVDLKPSRFEDIIAMVSLYRPGPMANIPSYINRKYEREKIEYPISVMSEYLSDTYGITIYQEQVMLLSQLLASFTPGEADQLRKAMGKKKIDEMAKLESSFYERATKNGHNISVLRRIWDEWKKFAEYAFNKSHATCYALVSYQTAYLKAHYPSEFIAALLTNNLDRIDEIRKFIKDAGMMNIKILHPDINESSDHFTVISNGDIRFGLAALKGIGSNAVAAILEERENGSFKDIFDFFKRINLRVCTKKNIEALVLSGAFDGFTDMHRAQFFHSDDDKTNFIDKIIAWGNQEQKLESQGQFSLFGESEEMQKEALPALPIVEEWTQLEKLKHEKEIAGFYISGYPLDAYEVAIQHFCNTTVAQLQDVESPKYMDRTFRFAGIITKVQTGVTKNNSEWGKMTIEDETGSYEWFIRGNDFIKYKNYFIPNKLIYAKGLVRSYFDKGKMEQRYQFSPIGFLPLDEIYEKMCSEIHFTIDVSEISTSVALSLQEAIQNSPGEKMLYFTIINSKQNYVTNLSNISHKIDPETFVKNLKIHANYTLVLK